MKQVVDSLLASCSCWFFPHEYWQKRTHLVCDFPLRQSQQTNVAPLQNTQEQSLLMEFSVLVAQMLGAYTDYHISSCICVLGKAEKILNYFQMLNTPVPNIVAPRAVIDIYKLVQSMYCSIFPM